MDDEKMLLGNFFLQMEMSWEYRNIRIWILLRDEQLEEAY